MSEERNVENEESERAADRNIDRNVDRAEEDFEGHRMELDRNEGLGPDEAERFEKRFEGRPEERHID